MLIKSEDRIKQLEGQIEQLRSAVEELTVLNDLAITASSSLQVDRVLDIIVEKSIKALKAEQGSILLVTDQRDRPLQTLIRQADRQSRILDYRVGSHITGWVLKHHAPLLIEDLSSDDRFQPSDQEKSEIKTLLCVPIQFQGKVLGIITVTNKKNAVHFNLSDQRLLSIIAAQSGQLIRNSQLQEEALEKNRLALELETARKIQENLIPKSMPQLPELEIASFFNPADEMGGDYFDFLFLENNQVVIVIADVSGHGASAAMIMAMLKGILQSHLDHFQSPEKGLSHINKILHRTLPAEIFVTMGLLVYDPSNQSLLYTNAGHPPLLYYDNLNHSLSYLELRGCPLNGLTDPTYTSLKIELHANDLILLYTDGLSETMNKQQEMWGYSRLKDFVNNAHRLSVQDLIHRIQSESDSFRGGEKQADDIAMILLRAKVQQ
jgi:sigma-B regulation protein RsbU (phosphoserine phosphatase)